MQSGFVKAICQMGVFMICAQAIVHFRPKASYEKYLKMLVSAMILMQLLLAIGSIFSPEGEQELAQRAEWFADSMEESMRQAAAEALFPEADEVVRITGVEPERMESEEALDAGKISVQVTPVTPVQIDAMQGEAK